MYIRYGPSVAGRKVRVDGPGSGGTGFRIIEKSCPSLFPYYPYIIHSLFLRLARK